MNPELDRRLTELTDAAARATTGIDPVTTLAAFRRRRRTRTAASSVAAVAAVVGLALGAAQLGPDVPVDPADTVEWPTADPSLPQGACGSAAENMPIMDSAIWPAMSPAAVSVGRGEAPDLTVTITNLSGEDYTLWPERTVHLVLVRDGLVVGFTAPASQGPTAVPDDGELAISDFGPAVLCEAGELVPRGSLEGRDSLPEGTYRAWPVTASLAGNPDDEWTFGLIGDEGSLTVTEAQGSEPPVVEPSDAALACGLPVGEGVAAVTGLRSEDELAEDARSIELSARLPRASMSPEGALDTSTTVTYRPMVPVGPERSTLPDYRLWAFVTDPAGTVVAHAEPWDQASGWSELGRVTMFVPCPGEPAPGERAGEELLAHVAAVANPALASSAFALSEPLPFTVLESEPIWLEGPGSCGMAFFLDGVSESEGALLGLSTELTDLTLSPGGTLTGHVVIWNKSDAQITGSYVLKHLLVQEYEGPYYGSILTLAEPLDLTDVVSLATGGATRVELDLAMTACAEDVLPLEAGQYSVSTIVDLVAPGEPIGFSSPAVEVSVD